MNFPPPTELKFIQPFIQRAAELKNRDPIVSYYALYYAAQVAIEKGVQSEESKGYLLALMDNLEKEKKLLSDKQEINDSVAGYDHVLNFASRIFNSADDVDRNGAASKDTAKSFFASSQFFELLNVFKVPDDEILEKIKYAKFKAADILKAIKEGRTPTPGTGVNISDVTEETANIAPPLQPTNFPPEFQQQQHLSISQEFHQQTVNTPTAPPPFTNPTTSTVPPIVSPIQTPPSFSLDPFKIDHKALSNATKNARHAISAIQYEDIPTAIDNLKKAIELLQPFMDNQEN